MSLRLARPALRLAAPSCSRPASSRATTQWPSKTHLRKAPEMPAPLPALFAQRVVLSDGSTFTSYTTAPAPQTLRMTRDVTNNPLWTPGSERRGLGDGIEEGRVGRFRRRFEMGAGEASDAAEENAEDAAEQQPPQTKNAFAEADLAWMSEGAKADTVGAKQLGGKQKTKGKKK